MIPQKEAQRGLVEVELRVLTSLRGQLDTQRFVLPPEFQTGKETELFQLVGCITKQSDLVYRGDPEQNLSKSPCNCGP